ncbi:MAG: hypothetical protein QNK37_30395 [Acidobacteriota bacterium]|nr:hypothetical protein [Acidobacteriota bacterium]
MKYLIIVSLALIPLQSISSTRCDECDPGSYVYSYGIQVTRVGTTGCTYRLKVWTYATIGQVSYAFTDNAGTFPAKSGNTIFSDKITYENNYTVMQGDTYELVAGHGAGAGFLQSCKSCKNGTVNCPISATGGGAGTENGSDDCDPVAICGEDTFGHGGPNLFCPEYYDCLYLCPLVIDLGNDGFHLGRPGTSVWFDMLGNGEPERLQWVRSGENDAFLVNDINGNGIVDDGRELFGHGTRLLLNPDQHRPNGFVALAEYDDPQLGGNADGYITGEDEVWSTLSLWLDSDADGLSAQDEMITLQDAGIEQLGIIPKEKNRYDEAGNWLRYWSSNRGSRSPRLAMVDIFFRRID